jgi:hypothetical protein
MDLLFEKLLAFFSSPRHIVAQARLSFSEGQQAIFGVWQ